MSDLVLGLIAGLLFLVVASPLRSASIFVLFRPLMQAYSVLHIPFLGFPTTTIHSGLLLLATLFSLFRKGSRLIIRHIVILYILVAYAMISFTKAADKAEAFTGLVKILTALALYVLVYNGIKNYKGGVTFLKACAYSAVIPTVFGIAQRMTGKWALSYDIYGGNRITSVIGIANAYGIYLSFVTIPVIILILLKVRRKTNVVILVLIIINQVLAMNRGTWLAFSTAMIIASLCYFKRVKVKYVVIAFVLIAVFFSGTIMQRFGELEDPAKVGVRLNTFEQRLNYWQSIIPVIMQEPIVGHGLGQAQAVSEKYFHTEAIPHNDYIRFALEIGIPGTFLYALFLFFEFSRNAWLVATKHRWQINFPMFVLIMYFIVISFTQNIYFSTVNFPLFLSLVAMSLRMNEMEWEGAEQEYLPTGGDALEPGDPSDDLTMPDVAGGPVRQGHTH